MRKGLGRRCLQRLTDQPAEVASPPAHASTHNSGAEGACVREARGESRFGQFERYQRTTATTTTSTTSRKKTRQRQTPPVNNCSVCTRGGNAMHSLSLTYVSRACANRHPEHTGRLLCLSVGGSGPRWIVQLSTELQGPLHTLYVVSAPLSRQVFQHTRHDTVCGSLFDDATANLVAEQGTRYCLYLLGEGGTQEVIVLALCTFQKEYGKTR